MGYNGNKQMDMKAITFIIYKTMKYGLGNVFGIYGTSMSRRGIRSTGTV